MLKIKLTAQEWCDLTGADVRDPDGWDRFGDFVKDWETPITLQEFLSKLSASTAKWPPGLMENPEAFVFGRLTVDNI
jgi:hypothetical protein